MTIIEVVIVVLLALLTGSVGYTAYLIRERINQTQSLKREMLEREAKMQKEVEEAEEAEREPRPDVQVLRAHPPIPSKINERVLKLENEFDALRDAEPSHSMWKWDDKENDLIHKIFAVFDEEYHNNAMKSSKSGSV